MLTITKRFTFKVLLGGVCCAWLVGCKPPGPRALLDGKRQIDRGRFELAVDRLKVATQLMPTNSHAWNYLGIAYHQSGQSSNAVLSYQRALQLNPDLSEVRLNLGSLWLEQGQVAQAKSEFMAYNLRRPNDPVGFRQLATAELRGQELVAAEAHISKALQLNEADAEALNILGMIQLQQRKPAEAARSFQASLEKDENLAAARFNLAVVLHHQLGDRPGALKQYRHYLELKPRPADATEVAALVQQLEAELNPPLVRTEPPRNPPSAKAVEPPPAPAAKPVAAAPKAKVPPIQTKPRPVEIAATREAPKPAPSNRVAAESRPPEIARAEPAPELVPVSRPAPRKPGVTPLPGDPPRERFTETDLPAATLPTPPVPAEPNSTTGTARTTAERWAEKGARALAARRYAEATEAFKSAAAADPGWFQAHLNYSAAAFEAGRTREALSAGRRALALQPDSFTARYNLALALKQAEQIPAAIAELETLTRTHPAEAHPHLTLANLYANELRQSEKARRHYLKVLEINPKHPQAAAIHFWMVANPAK